MAYHQDYQEFPSDFRATATVRHLIDTIVDRVDLFDDPAVSTVVFQRLKKDEWKVRATLDFFPYEH